MSPRGPRTGPQRKPPTERVRGRRLHGDVQGDRGGAWEPVFAMVRRIPSGRVMTYGQIATLLENRLSPRAVGWALHGCPADVPWQRVVNASGGCSTDRVPGTPTGLQRSLLEDEGVVFRESGTLELARYRHAPGPIPREPTRRATRKGRGRTGASRP